MPAKHLHRVAEEKTYSHLYNRGVERRIIFNDEQDYEVFQDFLKDYLTPPANPESTKKAFTVNGHIFRGSPHQPKNYFNKVELMAYGLMPDHFHLLLHQKTRGSLEGLIRSLCTRYSMYFNKKYQRTGALFEGPYKSVQIKDISQLPPLTRYIHHGSNNYSSYPEYSGKRKTSWVNTNIIPFSKKADNHTSYNTSHYKDSELPDGITFENETQYLERRDLTTNVEGAKETGIRIPEILAIFAVFLVLLGLGLRNISISTAKSLANSPTEVPSVLSETTQPTNSPKPKITLMVKNAGESTPATIHKEPSTNSEKVGEAMDGDIFEFDSINSGWYGVKLTDGSTGFIHSEYIEIIETNNQ